MSDDGNQHFFHSEPHTSGVDTGRKAPLLGVPVMMASRMVLGVHYPTDTAVGAAIGAATAEVVMKGMKHE